jgi:hypothetical protein
MRKNSIYAARGLLALSLFFIVYGILLLGFAWTAVYTSIAYWRLQWVIAAGAIIFGAAILLHARPWRAPDHQGVGNLLFLLAAPLLILPVLWPIIFPLDSQRMTLPTLGLGIVIMLLGFVLRRQGVRRSA